MKGHATHRRAESGNAPQFERASPDGVRYRSRCIFQGVRFVASSMRMLRRITSVLLIAGFAQTALSGPASSCVSMGAAGALEQQPVMMSHDAMSKDAATSSTHRADGAPAEQPMPCDHDATAGMCSSMSSCMSVSALSAPAAQSVAPRVSQATFVIVSMPEVPLSTLEPPPPRV